MQKEVQNIMKYNICYHIVFCGSSYKLSSGANLENTDGMGRGKNEDYRSLYEKNW